MADWLNHKLGRFISLWLV